MKQRVEKKETQHPTESRERAAIMDLLFENSPWMELGETYSIEVKGGEYEKTVYLYAADRDFYPEASWDQDAVTQAIEAEAEKRGYCADIWVHEYEAEPDRDPDPKGLEIELTKKEDVYRLVRKD